MKICGEHWKMMREAIAERGLDALVLKSAEAAMENEVTSLQGAKQNFDPLMSMHWHYSSNALQMGGLYLMAEKEDGTDHCPLCEMASHVEAFDPQASINNTADQMRDYAIGEGLIARPS